MSVSLQDQETSFRHLPEDLLIKILLSLPVKTIGQCKCVEKRWNRTLSDPYTILEHLSKTTETKLLVQPRPTPSNLHGLGFHAKKGFAYNLHVKSSSHEIFGSCKGLVLIQDSNSQMALLNPTTKKSKKLAPGLTVYWSREKKSIYGLGFNHKLADYRVIEISGYSHPLVDGQEFFVSDYSLREHRWNPPIPTLYNFDVSTKCGILVEGALHWLAKNVDESLVITAYSVSDDGVFKLVPAPSNGDLLKDMEHKFLPELEIVHERLALITGEFWVGIHVWIMKEYGAVESWTQLSILLDYIDCVVVPIACPEDCLIVKEGGTFRWLVFSGKEVKTLPIQVLGLPANFRVGRSWSESLVPLTQSG